MFTFRSLLRGKRSASRPARLTTAAPRRVRPGVERLEDRLAPALTGPPVALTISAPSQTVAVGNTLPFQATEIDAAGNSADVTSRVAWSASIGTGQGTIGTALLGTPPGLFTGLIAGTVLVQAMDSQAVAAPLLAQTTVTVVNPAPAATTVSVVSSNPAPVYGETVFFTATVSTQPSSQAVPTGAVEFVIDGFAHPIEPLTASGTATIEQYLDAGSPHTVVVNYHNRDGRFADSSGSLAGGQTVNKAITATSVLASNRSPLVNFDFVTFTAFVSAMAPSDFNPSHGIVTFSSDGVPIATTFFDTSFTASYSTYFLTPGNHTIRAFYNGDGNYVSSSDSLTVSVRPLTANQNLVVHLYQDLLHRDVTSRELADWTGALDAGVSPTRVALAIERSLEGRAVEVDSAFRKFLGRHALPSELERFGALLQTNTVEDMDAILLGSSEYFTKRVGNNSDPEREFVQVLLYDTLGPAAFTFTITPIERFLTDEVRRGVSRVEVARQVLASPVYKLALVDDWYNRFLNRPAIKTPINWLGFAGQLLNGTSDEEVIAEIVGSAEYFQKP
jgi:hypothetical protein